MRLVFAPVRYDSAILVADLGRYTVSIRRRWAMACFGGAAAALAVGSMAFACTAPQGASWYSDGTFVKSGASGTVITVFATNANPGQQFKLVAGTNITPGHEDHACMDIPSDINPNVRISSFRGFIGNTTGRIVRAPGDWQICFRQLSGATATSPVFFSVI